MTFRAGIIGSVRPSRSSSASPDDFVAGATDWRPPAVLRSLLGRLEDGAAVLHGGGLGRLLVLGQHGAGLVWTKAIGEVGVGHPRRPGGGARASARGGCGLGAWTENNQHATI